MVAKMHRMPYQLQVSFRKRATNYRAVCGKRALKIRLCMHLRHPLCDFPRLMMPYLYIYMGIGTDVNVFHFSCCMASHMSQASFASCRSLSEKEPLILGLFCGKWPINIRHLMHLQYPFLASHMSGLYEKASNESCRTRMSHDTQEWVMSHKNESHLAHDWVMSHAWRVACTERLPMGFCTTIYWWH